MRHSLTVLCWPILKSFRTDMRYISLQPTGLLDASRRSPIFRMLEYNYLKD